MADGITDHFLRDAVQVNIPFTWLWDRYLQRFISLKLNPEIGIDAAALDRFKLGDYRPVADQLAENSLSVTLHGPFFDLAPGSLDPGIRAVTRRRFAQLLEWAAVFQPKSVVCHAGYEDRRYGYVREQWFENSLRMWTWLARRLKRLGCRLMLENVFERDPADMIPLFDALRPLGVGYCLDVGHQAAFGRAALHTWLDQLGGDIAQLHLHDNNGQRDEHLPMGQGSIDFARLFRSLRELCGTPPIITLEPHHENDLLPSLKYLGTVWPW